MEASGCGAVGPIEAAEKAIEHLAALDTAGYADLLILETLARYARLAGDPERELSILARITDQESEERRAQLRTQMALTAAELGRHREAIAYWWQALGGDISLRPP